MIIGVAIWPSAPILWLLQRGDTALGIPGITTEQLQRCVDAMQQSLQDIGEFDRALILGPVAPRPVAPRPVAMATRAAGRSFDPLADLDPAASLPSSIVGRLLAGFGFNGPADGVEVGVHSPDGHAGMPPTTAMMAAGTNIRASIATAVQTVRAAGARTLLVVVGDGAAAHGDHAPLARDDRSGDYDRGIRLAIEDGRPDVLAQALAVQENNIPIGIQLGAVGFWPLSALAALRLSGEGRLYYDAAPLGVGYQVGAVLHPNNEQVSREPARGGKKTAPAESRP